MKRISITEINRLALPALVSGVIEPLISLTDTIMAGHIALNTKEVLGAVGIVSSFLTSLVWIFIQSSRAITSQVAHAYGQDKLNQLKSLVAQILTLSLGLSLLCSIFAFFTSEVILTNFYDADGILLDYCLDYFRIRVWGFPFTLLTLTIHSIFRGMQNTSYQYLRWGYQPGVQLYFRLCPPLGYQGIGLGESIGTRGYVCRILILPL